jgi:manganese transport protein
VVIHTKLSRPDFSEIIASLVPTLPEHSLVLVVALTASSFSIGGAFYQSYLVQAKGWKRKDHSKASREGFSGIMVLGLISAMILISAGSVLKPMGVEVTSVSDMARALEPVYGQLATSVFMVGLFGASFSSLIGNSTIGGSIFAGVLGLGSNINDKKVKYMIMMIMILGAAISIIFGESPLELIVFAQGLTIFIVPFIGVAMFVIGIPSTNPVLLDAPRISNFVPCEKIRKLVRRMTDIVKMRCTWL